MTTVTQDDLAEVINGLASRVDTELLSMSADEISSEWYFKWEEDRGIVWNAYQFNEILSLHKRRWRKWEEHHNGSCRVVERVRDKYVLPRIQEFLITVLAHQED